MKQEDDGSAEDDSLRGPPIAVACSQCGVEFETRPVLNPFDPRRIMFTQKACQPCIDAINQAEAEKERLLVQANSPEARMANTWAALCPKAYRLTTEGGLTSIERLRADQPLLSIAEGVNRYAHSHIGLLFRGDSGGGKTRVMWRVLRRQFDSGRSIVALTAGEFEREFRDAAGAFRLQAWFDRLVKVDCFFLDDLGKSRWSQNTVETFFDLVEKRSGNGQPCFVTTNYAREQLAEKLALAKDEAEPMLRRLVENCALHKFKPAITTGIPDYRPRLAGNNKEQ